MTLCVCLVPHSGWDRSLTRQNSLCAVIQMQDKPEYVADKMEDERSDDQQSDDLSLSIPLPPTPASVCSLPFLPP